MNQLIKQFNLPNYIKGKSFAEASKLIDKKFKDRKDSVSLKTKDALLQRLADMQEHMKMKDQVATTSQSPMQSGLPQQQMAYGGNTNQYFMGGLQSLLGDKKGFNWGDKDKLKAGIGSGLDIASSVASPLLDNSNQDGLGKPQDPGSSAIGGALSGAKAGMALGPIGAVGGALIGGVTSLIGGNKAYKNYMRKEREGSQLHANEINNQYAKGGYTNDYVKGGPYDPVKGIDISNLMNNTLINPLTNKSYDRPLATGIDTKDLSKPGLTQQDSSKLRLNQSGFNTEDLHRQGDIKDVGVLSNELQSTNPMGYKTSKVGRLFNQAKHNVGEGLSKGADWMKNNYGSIMRGAPVATNALQLMNMKKPEYKTRQKLDQRYKKQYVDEMQLQNKVQNEYNNTSQALANASGGSTGSLRTNLLGAQLNKTKALSDAYMKADNINRSENEKGFRYGLETGKFNIDQDNLEKDVNARNLGAYNTERSKLISALGENIGDIGKEKVSSKRIGEMLGYDVDGDYLVDKESGEKITVQEAIKRNKKGKKNGFTEELKALNLFKNKDKKPSLSNRSFSPSFYNR